MRREEREMKTITIRIFKEDHEFLLDAFPPPLGYNKVVRHVIHKFCKAVEEQRATLPNATIDIDEE